MNTIELNKTLKLGSETKIKINGYNVKFGTTDSKAANCVYFTFSGYVKPNVDCDLNDEMKEFKRHFRCFLRDCVNQLFPGQINPHMPIIDIVDFSDTHTATNAIRINKIYTFFDIDVTFYLNQNVEIRNNSSIGDSFSLLSYAICDFLDESRYLNFSPIRVK